MLYYNFIGFVVSPRLEQLGGQAVKELWSRQESNLDLVFRKHLFYPLNYGTIGYLVAEDSKNNHIIWYLYASNTTQYGFLQYHY